MTDHTLVTASYLAAIAKFSAPKTSPYSVWYSNCNPYSQRLDALVFRLPTKVVHLVTKGAGAPYTQVGVRGSILGDSLELATGWIRYKGTEYHNFDPSTCARAYI